MQPGSTAIAFAAGVLTLLAAAAIGAMDAPAQGAEKTIPVWPGVAPGSEHARQVEKVSPFPNGKFNVVRNVVEPTLTVYLPEPATATGTGVVIAPGGGFRFLTMDAEGHDAARWLQERGIAAFVLKYRLVETHESDALMWREFMALMSRERSSSGVTLTDEARLGIADGIQAMKVVYEHAAQWGVSAQRIGFLGFSAGAMIASHVMLEAGAPHRPAFVAPIYGAPFGGIPAIPANAPPVFLAYASDDDLVRSRIEAFYAALRQAGQHPELHVYAKGGHGFGMNRQGASSDYWIEDLYHWMESLGLTTAPGERR